MESDETIGILKIYNKSVSILTKGHIHGAIVLWPASLSLTIDQESYNVREMVSVTTPTNIIQSIK